jgi:hypothetical protein
MQVTWGIMLKQLLAALLVFTGLAIGQVAGTPDITPAQQAPINAAQLPFFFPKGFYKTTDPLRQREEYVRWLNSTWNCNQGNPNGMGATIPGSDSITVQTDVVSTDSVTENPAHMKMVFDHYIKQADGNIRYSDLCHTEILTPAQFAVVQAGLQKQAVEAAQRDYDFYKVVYDHSIEVRAQKLGLKKEEFVKQLDEKAPGYNVTFREISELPKPMHPSDFVPRELHLGFNPPLGGILGVTWMNTGVIYYNPDAWITDYLNGIPKVMQHEEVHGNINIQKWPMSEAFDVELIASLPEMLYEENKTDFPSHGYAADIRELAQIYYGMDWAEMRKQTVKFDFAGNIVYDDEKYIYYYGQIEKVKKEMMTFFMDVTIPEFYSDPIWWSAMNDVRGDSNSVFRMTMADHYQICSLGGCAASEQWLAEHKDEIKEIAQKALDAGLGKNRSGGNFSDRVSPWMVEQYDRMFTPNEQAQIETYFRAHPEQLENLRHMTPAEAIQFMQRFKANPMSGVTVR